MKRDYQFALQKQSEEFHLISEFHHSPFVLMLRRIALLLSHEHVVGLCLYNLRPAHACNGSRKPRCTATLSAGDLRSSPRS